MISKLIVLIVIFGFVYGTPYFKFMDQNQSGTYILSLQWWNIKLNWSEFYGKSRVSICAIFPRFQKDIRYTEHYIIFDDSGVYFRHFDITNK